MHLRLLLLTASLLASAPAAWCQTGRPHAAPANRAAPPAQPSAQPAEPSDQPSGSRGTVLFSRDAPSNSSSAAAPDSKTAPPATPELLPNQPDPLQVTEAERTSLTVTAYTLDVHLSPAAHGLAARAGLTIRNDGPAPLTRLVLQISSSLHWDALSIARPAAPLERLSLTARRLATDADHTGFASEIVVPLPAPLAPGASLPLVAAYSGTIPQSAERLLRIGAPVAQAAGADWDAIDDAPAADSSATAIALRGFGDVLWYPVSAPPVFLGEGARLFDLAGRTRLREQAATISLRFAMEFTGDSPSTVFFCGRAQPLTAVRDNPDAPAATGTGVASATFAPQPLGFRVPSLFVTGHPPTAAGTTAHPGLIAVTTEHFDALPSLAAAARQVEPLLTDWLGPHPSAPLDLLDHPGQPFEDGTLLVRPIAAADSASALTASLAHSLTHAWIHSEHPWISEGLAQFLTLLWAEHTQGRAAVIDQLQDSARTIALAEPDTSAAQPAPSSPASSSSSSAAAAEPTASAASGQPLIRASSDVFFRSKAAAVWWMLRGITGDDALRQALQTYRQDPKTDADPASFQHVLERASHQDLRWFFDDWVYRDRGLPDLTVVNVTPRQLEGTARSGGWLVSVEVRNDGDCVADVPVTIRSAAGVKGSNAATETQRLRIPGHATVTRRIVFPVPPAEVQMNDGTTPETRISIHTEHIGPPAP